MIFLTLAALWGVEPMQTFDEERVTCLKIIKQRNNANRECRGCGRIKLGRSTDY